jgi:membrane protease YdiL (CAAX protease family)
MQWIESLGVETVQDTVKLLQTSTDPQILGLMIFAAVVAAPICEEIVFRGYLYSASKHFTGPWVAGICSALVFSATHGSLAPLLPLFILGCILAFIYQKTGSLWAPIAVHFCFNGATVVIQMAARFQLIELPPS